MKTMDHVKRRIITSMVAILLLIITLFGITYAYFTAKIQGNTNPNSIFVSAGKLSLEYGDGNGEIIAEKIKPGTILEEKTFTVTNTGTREIESYEVIVENVYNDLEFYQDLTYVLTCKSYKTNDYENNKDKATEVGTCKGNKDIFPKDDDYLVRNFIDVDITHVYSLKLTYNETNKDQSKDMKKRVTARVNIIDDEENYKNVFVYGNSVQSGEPTPTTPVEIESVGDRKNLLDINYNMPYTGYGINVSKNSDGSINVKGNVTKIASLYIAQNLNLTLPAGTYTLSNTGISGINAYLLPGYYKDTFTLKQETTFTGAYIDVTSSVIGQDIDFVYYPQLEEGEKATEYTPYGKYSIQINTNGKNIFALENYEGNVNWSGIKHPTYTKVKVKPNTKYTFSVKYLERTNNIEDGDVVLYVYGDSSLNESHRIATGAINLAGNTGLVREPFSFTFTVGDYDEIYCVLRTNSGATTNVKINGMMLRETGTDANFESYIESKTYNIILDEPLRKVGNSADYIDLYEKKLYRNVERYDFSENKGVDYYSSRINGSWNTCVVALEFENKKIGYGTSLCNYFKRVDNANPFTASVATNGLYSDHPSNSNIYINIGTSANLYNSSNPISNWENFNKTYCIAEVDKLLTPELLDIDIPRINKNSIITVDTSIQPSKIETEY